MKIWIGAGAHAQYGAHETYDASANERFSFALALEPVQGATDQSGLLCSPSCWWVYYATQTDQTSKRINK